MQLNIKTNQKQEVIDITDKVNSNLNIDNGMCVLYCPHTTAGLTINEGADPSVRKDIINALDKIIPEMNFQHSEGNSPAHIKSSIMGNTLTIFVEGGKLKLGTWQSIFFCEFDGPRNRKVYMRQIKD